ncbi:hypothetical protein BGX33_001858 [Mortierella sp. NVP41]|nr:hypothetical protein BGX33_001858 [Mortierella sp. NVP41]
MSTPTPSTAPTQDNYTSDEDAPLVKDSPLRIPELLEMIFSCLSSHQVRQSVLAVSRQWYKLALPHAFRLITWNLDRDAHKDDNEDSGGGSNGGGGTKAKQRTSSDTVDPLKHLTVAQHFIIKTDNRTMVLEEPHEYRSAFTTKNWQALVDGIMSRWQRLKLSELQLLCPITFGQEAMTLLMLIGKMLTALRLEATRRDSIYLDEILKLCTKLEVLTVEYSCSNHQFARETFRGPREPALRSELPSSHSLRSLTLRRIVMDTASLLSLVDSCPMLKALVLDQVFGIADQELEERGGRFYPAVVFRSIAGIRPDLSRFGFLPCVLSASTEFLLARLVSLFSKVTEWVLPAMSYMDLCDICDLRRGQLTGRWLAVLTSLEIQARYPGLEAMRLGSSLHTYLCTPSLSRHLLQLKAPDVVIPLDYLDLEGVLGFEGAYNRTGLATWPSMPYPMSSEKVMIWGCRDLKVLHIQIQCRARDCGSAESSRLMFGYISKVCPALEDLQLQKEHMSLSMEGGMCLLSRLDGLKRLCLAAIDGVWDGTWDGTQATTADLEWVANELSSKQMAKLKGLTDQYISEEVFNPVRRRFPMDYRPPEIPGVPLPVPSIVVSELQDIDSGDEDIDSGDEDIDSGGDESKDGETVDTEGGVANDSMVPDDYMIDGVDMRYLGQLQGIVETNKHRISNGTPCWPKMEYLEIVKQGAFCWAFWDVQIMTAIQLKQMRPDVAFRAYWDE